MSSSSSKHKRVIKREGLTSTSGPPRPGVSKSPERGPVKKAAKREKSPSIPDLSSSSEDEEVIKLVRPNPATQQPSTQNPANQQKILRDQLRLVLPKLVRNELKKNLRKEIEDIVTESMNSYFAKIGRAHV